jgi:hypothetical protein
LWWSGRLPNTCSQLELGVTLHVSTADGLFDETMSGKLIGTRVTASYGAKQLQQSAFGARIASAFDLEPSMLKRMTVTLGYVDGFDGVSAQITIDTDTDADAGSADGLGALQPVAQFDSHWPTRPDTHVHYEPPHAFDDACAATQPTMEAAGDFASNQDMLEALSGHWLRCYGDSTNAPSYVGLEIDRSGKWRYLALNDGGLVEQVGFLGEGMLDIIDTSAMNSGLGSSWRQVNWDFGITGAGPTPSVQFSSDRNTLRLTVPDDGGLGETLFDDVYKRTQMAVAAATITARTASARAKPLVPKARRICARSPRPRTCATASQGAGPSATAAFAATPPGSRSPPTARIGTSTTRDRSSWPVATKSRMPGVTLAVA